MNGREDKKQNDLFFVCSLIDYIARRTKNERKVVVNALGKDKLEHLYDLADVYHSENIDQITHELVNECPISIGVFDNVAACQYRIPTHWDMGKVYHRLIIDVCKAENKSAIDSLMEVYNSWISASIDDYSSSMYYENPSYLFASYKAGKPL
ncbi:MAG: hypothetical protein RSA92_03915 [Bacteroidaceae bacterium]